MTKKCNRNRQETAETETKSRWKLDSILLLSSPGLRHFCLNRSPTCSDGNKYIHLFTWSIMGCLQISGYWSEYWCGWKRAQTVNKWWSMSKDKGLLVWSFRSRSVSSINGHEGVCELYLRRPPHPGSETFTSSTLACFLHTFGHLLPRIQKQTKRAVLWFWIKWSATTEYQRVKVWFECGVQGHLVFLTSNHGFMFHYSFIVGQILHAFFLPQSWR